MKYHVLAPPGEVQGEDEAQEFLVWHRGEILSLVLRVQLRYGRTFLAFGYTQLGTTHVSMLVRGYSPGHGTARLEIIHQAA